MAVALSSPARDCALVTVPRQEGPWGGQEVPQGVWDRAPGPVVHRLPLEESLPALPGLNLPGRLVPYAPGPMWLVTRGRHVTGPQQKPEGEKEWTLGVWALLVKV